MTGVTARQTIAWFHCYAGIAGDMALGSLLDAGADLDEVRTLLGRLDLPGWDLQVEGGLRGGISCTRVVVEGDDAVVRTHAAIVELIDGSRTAAAGGGAVPGRLRLTRQGRSGAAPATAGTGPFP